MNVRSPLLVVAAVAGFAIPSLAFAEDIPVHQAEEIAPVTAQEVTPVTAQEIAPYVAATIKRMPARTNLYDAVKKAWSQPLRCEYACRVTAAATMRSISASLVGMMAYQAPSGGAGAVRVASGEAQLDGGVDGKVRLKFTKRARKALLMARRTVKVTVTTSVVDVNGAVAERVQTVTLKAPKRTKRR